MREARLLLVADTPARWPERHHAHAPAAADDGTVTRSPTAQPRARRRRPRPPSPASSWPGTCGQTTSASCPTQACQSLRHSPDASTATTTRRRGVPPGRPPRGASAPPGPRPGRQRALSRACAPPGRRPRSPTPLIRTTGEACVELGLDQAGGARVAAHDPGALHLHLDVRADDHHRGAAHERVDRDRRPPGRDEPRPAAGRAPRRPCMARTVRCSGPPRRPCGGRSRSGPRRGSPGRARHHEADRPLRAAAGRAGRARVRVGGQVEGDRDQVGVGAGGVRRLEPLRRARRGRGGPRPRPRAGSRRPGAARRRRCAAALGSVTARLELARHEDSSGSPSRNTRPLVARTSAADPEFRLLRPAADRARRDAVPAGHDRGRLDVRGRRAAPSCRSSPRRIQRLTAEAMHDISHYLRPGAPRAAARGSSTTPRRRATTGSSRSTCSRTSTSPPAACCRCARTPAPRS